MKSFAFSLQRADWECLRLGYKCQQQASSFPSYSSLRTWCHSVWQVKNPKLPTTFRTCGWMRVSPGLSVFCFGKKSIYPLCHDNHVLLCSVPSCVPDLGSETNLKTRQRIQKVFGINTSIFWIKNTPVKT